MASPLLEFANAYVLITTSDTVHRNEEGRFYVNETAYKVVRAYMQRVQYTGVTSGSRKIPLASELNGEMLPGASGDEFYYRGYALEYTTLLNTAPFLTNDLESLPFVQITGTETFLRPQKEVKFRFGTQAPMKATIQRSNGKFGGEGIDQIIYESIGGVEFQLTGAEVLN